MSLAPRSALLVVDVQNDFCPGGALAVSGGDQVCAPLNVLMAAAPFVVASKDWHPPETVHFETWPVHCVRDTPGAELHPDLDADRIDVTVLKGTADRDDGYSAFEATSHDLTALLRERSVDHLYVGGLATDYCVKATVLDALEAGFEVTLLTDAVVAVDLEPGDGEAALEEMRTAGARLTTTEAALLGVGRT